MKFLRRLLNLFRRRKLDAEMRAEMLHHLAEQTRRNEQAGMPLIEAYYAAERQFGSVTSIQERAREERGWVWLEQLGQDLRYGLRQLARHPGFTLAVVGTLGLGLGVNTALFTVFDIFLLRPLPLHEPDRLVNIAPSHPRFGKQAFSYPDYLEYRRGGSFFSDLIASRYEANSVLGSRPGGRSGSVEGLESDFVPVWFVSENYFAGLQPQMTLGQPFTPGSDPGSVIVLSYRFWQRQLGSDPAVIGRTVRLNDQVLTVIGVAAPDFTGVNLPPFPTIGWVPLQRHWAFASWEKNRKDTPLNLLARLAPGVTIEQARAGMQLLKSQLGEPGLEQRGDGRIVIWKADTLLPVPPGAQYPAAITLLLAAFAMMLLVACANVMNLLLARAASRQQEVTIRLATGATRGRLIRQLLTESLLLSVLGGVAGLFIGSWTLRIVYSVVMSSAPGVHPAVREWLTFNLAPNYRVFAFAFVLAGIAGIAMGLAPALAAARADVSVLLQGAGTLFSGRIARSRLRKALVMGQVALSLTLLLGAGLLISNLWKQQRLDVGFEADRALTVLPFVASTKDTADRTWQGFLSDLEPKLAGVPGVTGVAVANFEPLRRLPAPARISVESGANPAAVIQAPTAIVSADYLGVLGVPLLRGRMFTTQDEVPGSGVVLVSDSLARRLWPGQDALGRQLQVDVTALTGGPRRAGNPPSFRSCQVVGIVRDAFYGDMLKPNFACLYVPRVTGGNGQDVFLIRTQSDPSTVYGGVRRAVEESGGIVARRTRLTESLEGQRAPAMAAAALAGALGGLGLVLAIIGLFGVIAFNVSRRTREIGIRAALGASPSVVVRTFVAEGIRLVAGGIAVGMLGGFALAQVMAKALRGTAPLDPPTFLGVTLALAFAALAACWLPARRAAKVDPIVALRAE